MSQISAAQKILTCSLAFECCGHVCFDGLPYTADVFFLCFYLCIIYKDINVKFILSVSMRLRHLERANMTPIILSVSMKAYSTCFITFFGWHRHTGCFRDEHSPVFRCSPALACSFICFSSPNVCFVRFVLSWTPTGKPKSVCWVSGTTGELCRLQSPDRMTRNWPFEFS